MTIKDLAYTWSRVSSQQETAISLKKKKKSITNLKRWGKRDIKSYFDNIPPVQREKPYKNMVVVSAPALCSHLSVDTVCILG